MKEMKDTITGAEALMRSLEHEGVKTIFGYPGGSIMPVFDALYDHRQTLNHILVRHEQGAAHAAQGFARVSGQVGVCLVTSGPGATNTITGIADAMIDSTPIVVIAGQVGTGFLGTDAFQEVDLVGITQPITKWSYQIRRAEDVPWAVARAFYIARSGRPGPVVLDFAKNAQVDKMEYAPVTVDFIRSYQPVPDMDEEAIREAADLINAAERPLVLVGQGVELGNAQAELRDFIEKAELPVGRTLLGLSALPTDHPLNKGMLGMHGNLGPNINTNKCDVLIAVGMRFDDRVTGNVATYAPQAKIIHFDIDPAEIDKNIKTDVAVLGDCKQTLPAVTELLKPATHKEWLDSFRTYEEVEEEKVIRPELYRNGRELSMGEVARAVSEATGNDAILGDRCRTEPNALCPLLQVYPRAQHRYFRRTGYDGLRFACRHRSNLRPSRPHRLRLHGRRRPADEPAGTGHGDGAEGARQDDIAQQQLPGQRPPVAGHVLQPPLFVHPPC